MPPEAPAADRGDPRVAARIAVAEAVAGALDSQGIRYAVIHGLESYPRSIGRDLDLLLDADDILRAEACIAGALKAMEWSTFFVRRLNGHTWCFVVERRRRLVFEFDLVPCLQWGFAFLAETPGPVVRRGPFKIDPWAAFVKRVLLQVLAGNLDRFRRRPAEALLDERERDEVPPRLAACVGPRPARLLLDTLERGDIAGLAQLRPTLRRAVTRRALARGPVQWVRAPVSWLRNELASSWLARPVMPIVALVGPDGVGKSTVIREVARRVERSMPVRACEIRHWRPGLLPSLGRLAGKAAGDPATPTPPRRTPGRLSRLRLAYYALDFLLGYWLRDRPAAAFLTLLLYDRCFLDMSVDPVRYALRGPSGTGMLARVLPGPDLVILLHDDPQRIHRRKPELPPEEIARQLDAWERWVRAGAVHEVIAVDDTPERLGERVHALVVDAFARRHESTG